jgi:hypothetical protein
LSFFAPVASDTNPGTHLYAAGNFAWGNTSSCGDGEGLIDDTIDGQEAGWPNTHTYVPQIVNTNNILIYNSGPGLQIDLNMNGSGPWAPIYVTHNTVANNGIGLSGASYCAQIVVGTTVNAQASGNLSATYQQHCFGGNSITSWAEAAVSVNTTTDSISGDFAYSSFGNSVAGVDSIGFTPGPNNITTIDPVFANPVDPGPPSCGSFASVPACMSNVISNFTPTNATAKSYGYQIPSNTSVHDPFFPQWLCGVTNLPPGLVTMGCS